MLKRLSLYRGHRFLGGRGVPHDVRRAAEHALRRDQSTVVVLDFAGVEGVSHSFADELLSPLTDLLNETVRERVWFVNVSDEVLEEMGIVATMHGLFLPSVSGDGQRPHA